MTKQKKEDSAQKISLPKLDWVTNTKNTSKKQKMK